MIYEMQRFYINLLSKIFIKCNKAIQHLHFLFEHWNSNQMKTKMSYFLANSKITAEQRFSIKIKSWKKKMYDIP